MTGPDSGPDRARTDDPGTEPAVTLDCLGRPCPIPVIELARALPAVPVGQVVALLSDDPAAAIDVPAWCRMRAQDYLGSQPLDDRAGHVHRVRRAR